MPAAFFLAFAKIMLENLRTNPMRTSSKLKKGCCYNENNAKIDFAVSDNYNDHRHDIALFTKSRSLYVHTAVYYKK